MKTKSQAGFIPLVVALIAALSLGGGFWAYKADKHKKEVKIEEQIKAETESKKGEDISKFEDSKSSNSLRVKDFGGKSYSEDRDDEYGDEGEDDDDRGGVRTPPVVVTPPPTTSGTGTTVKSYTLADVKLHSTSASCWTAVSGSVYDVTSWISQHPGGASAIKGMCGVDASGAFNGQHGGQSRPVSELTSFKIGVLK